MRALTLTRPWPWAFLYATPPKRIENRTRIMDFRPGERIALHAGLGWDAPGRAYLAADPDIGDVPRDGEEPYPAGSIVATARYVGLVEAETEMYAFGPFCFKFDRVIPCVPIRCRGALGLWQVPPEIHRQIRRPPARPDAAGAGE